MKKEPNKKPEKVKGGSTTSPSPAPKPKRKVKVESVLPEAVTPTPTPKVKPPKKYKQETVEYVITDILSSHQKQIEDLNVELGDYHKGLNHFKDRSRGLEKVIEELQAENEQLKCFCDAANYVKGELESAQSKIINSPWYKLLWMRIKGEI